MSLAIKFCTKCVEACFQDIFGSKNGFQGQNNVQNGSKQSGDVPRVFVKCVGVGRVKQRLKRGWRSLIFFVNFDVVTVRKVNLQFVGQ